MLGSLDQWPPHQGVTRFEEVFTEKILKKFLDNPLGWPERIDSGQVRESFLKKTLLNLFHRAF